MIHSVAKRMYYRFGQPGCGPVPPISRRTLFVVNALRKVAVDNVLDNLRLTATIIKLHLMVLVARLQSTSLHTTLHFATIRSSLVNLHALLLVRRADLTSSAYIRRFMINLTRLPAMLACTVATHPFLVSTFVAHGSLS